LIGTDHVAVGLDNHLQDQAARHRRQTKARTVAFGRSGIELVANFMVGVESPLEWRNIVRGLVSRGHPDDQIGKIVGANGLRVMEQVLK
jgi:microsomal dipeptidase-like Zn-dependent dipeptidase